MSLKSLMKPKLMMGAALLLVAGVGAVALASNMGFKINIPLTAGWANYVAIPYFNSYPNASAMFTDITGATAVKRWNNTTGTIEQWSGSRGTNFATTAGEAYIVNVAATTTWVVVGSHNDTASVTLTAGFANYIGVPYHTTRTTASELFTELPAATAVKRWNNTTGTIEQWSGSRGTNFALTPGEGYIANVSTTGAWAPIHY